MRGSSRLGSIISSHLPMLLELNVERTRGEIFAVSPIEFQSRCRRVPNEPIPMYGHSWPQLVLATGPGNPPAVRVWTGKTVLFGSTTVQKPDPQLLGGPNPDPYPSTRGVCQGWLDPSVLISGFSFQVFLFMVAFRYPTILCKILTLVHHCLCSIYWLPLKSKQAETCSLLHHEVECERFFILHH